MFSEDCNVVVTKIDRKRRSFVKAITWRICATLITFTICILITSSFNFAVLISAIEVVMKIIFFYFHERLWQKFNFWQKIF